MPPLPPGPPPSRIFGSNDTYRPSGHHPEYPRRAQHDGDSWRPSDDHTQYHQNDFSFRPDDNAPRYPPERERDEAAAAYNTGRRDNRYQTKRGAGRGNYGQRIFTNRRPTAERPLLTARGSNIEEQMLGFEQHGVQRFLPAEDLSDSGEDMEESEAEVEDPQIIATSPNSLPPVTEQGDMDAAERPAKRRALPTQSNEASSAPKWSNPDPYTVLPPVDDAQRKRTDVVKLIRKARIAAEKEEGAQNEVSKNTDFISFGSEDDRGPQKLSHPPGILGAPTGPRESNNHNHTDRAQVAMNAAPGASSVSASVGNMGPPPGLLSGSRPKPEVGKGKYPASTNTQNQIPTERLANGSRTNKDHITVNKPSVNANGDLGSRKRTHNDEIKGQVPRPPPRKKGKGSQSNGSLSSDWIPYGDVDATPWLVDSTFKTENPGFR